MKKRCQFLCFLILFSIFLILSPAESPSMERTGTFSATPSEAVEGTTSDGTAANNTAAGGTVSNSTAADNTTPDSTTPNGTAPDNTTSDGTTPDNPVPDGTTPDNAAPNGTSPENAPQEGVLPEPIPSDPVIPQKATPSSPQVSAVAAAQTGVVSRKAPLEVLKVITPYSDSLILADCRNARELICKKLEKGDYTTAVAILSDNSRIFCSIQYDLDSVDSAGTGLFYLAGTVEIPDDGSVTIDPDLAKTSLPFFLYDPQAPCELPVLSCDPPRDSQIALPQGTSPEDLQSQLMYDNVTYFYLDDGLSLALSLSWDLSGVAFNTPGTYRIYGRPDIPEGLRLSDQFSSFPCDVIIQENGAFSLTPPAFRGIYFVTYWTKPTPQREEIRRFYAVGDDGEWQEDVDGSFMHINSFDAQYMYVFYYDDVLFEVPYYFRLEYKGMFSNTLKIYLTADQLHYDLIEGDRDGGDRGEQPPPSITLPVPPSNPAEPEVTTPPQGDTPGKAPSSDRGDSGHSGSSGTSSVPSGQNNSSATGSGPSGHTGLSGGPGVPAVPDSLYLIPADALPDDPPPPRSEPPEQETAAGQETPAAASAVSGPESDLSVSPAQEEDTADYTVLSGKRIRKELEVNPGRPLVITKHHIRLEIPTDTGLFSDMPDQSLFRVDLTAPHSGSLRVALSVDGVPLSKPPAMTVTIPWRAAGSQPVLEILNQRGEVLGTAVCSADTVTFWLHETGTFTLRAQASPSEASAVGTSSGPVSPGSQSLPPGIYALASGVLFFALFILQRRNRGRRDKV